MAEALATIYQLPSTIKYKMDNLKKLIREVPDFPKPGINFYDITTLLKDPEGFEQTIDALDRDVPRRAGRYGDRRRVARLYLCRANRLSARRGIHPGSQAEEAPGRDRFGLIRTGIRHRTRSRCTRMPSAKAIAF